MHLTSSDQTRITGSFGVVREPDRPDVAAQSDPKVIATVSDAVRDRARRSRRGAWLRRAAGRLDRWRDFEITAEQVEQLTAPLPADLSAALDAGAERTRRFASMQRAHLHDFEDEVVPGVVCGQKYVPVSNVGAYLPAGRFPLLASAFMTVGVARAAGVPNIVSATPPSRRPATSGRALRRPGVRCRPDLRPGRGPGIGRDGIRPADGVGSDMIVGAGNAFVAEAKRQLYGKVGIDVLAGPSEVAVIADESASAKMVAADLLAQAEHGPTSPGVPGHHFGRAGGRGRGRDRASARGSGHPGDRRRCLA